uniref:Uncharacterized protein n=1 Tax=Sphaerodactylus townsendi TaxID=933632 RepID=A0ACB8F773_9SAUR
MAEDGGGGSAVLKALTGGQTGREGGSSYMKEERIKAEEDVIEPTIPKTGENCVDCEAAGESSSLTSEANWVSKVLEDPTAEQWLLSSLCGNALHEASCFILAMVTIGQGSMEETLATLQALAGKHLSEHLLSELI